MYLEEIEKVLTSERGQHFIKFETELFGSEVSLKVTKRKKCHSLEYGIHYLRHPFEKERTTWELSELVQRAVPLPGRRADLCTCKFNRLTDEQLRLALYGLVPCLNAAAFTLDVYDDPKRPPIATCWALARRYFVSQYPDFQPAVFDLAPYVAAHRLRFAREVVNKLVHGPGAKERREKALMNIRLKWAMRGCA